MPEVNRCHALQPNKPGDRDRARKHRTEIFWLTSATRLFAVADLTAKERACELLIERKFLSVEPWLSGRVLFRATRA